ncbi:MAG: AAA family ATPase [Desulfurococcales archaeon]|nr:AAA family ATPase [Desulfurococcales archaeon]
MHVTGIGETRIITDMRVFDETYVPPRLIVRDEDAEFLIRKYLLRLGRPGPTDVTLVFGSIGRVGIGKTTLVKYVGMKLAEHARGKKINYRYAYTNIAPARNSQEVLEDIARKLGIPAPIRGVSKLEALRQIVDYLYRHDMHVLIILDEFQRLLEPWFVDDGILYALLRVNEEIPAKDGINRVNFILVAQDFTVLSRMKEALPQLESQVALKLKLNAYKTEELYKILRQRAELGLRPGSWTDEILWTIAEEYGIDGGGHRPEGNARKAIIALRQAAEYAELDGSPVITRVHLSRAFSGDSIANIPESTIRGLGKHQLLLLLAIAQLTLEKSGSQSDYSTTGEVRKRYEELCELYGEKPRGHTQFNEYMRELARLDLIQAKRSGAGMRGKTTLTRIPPEIPPDSLKDLIEKILSNH